MTSHTQKKGAKRSAKGLVARDGFTTGMGVLAATLGSAVGLGNIWKFPYLTGENGGAAFILVYIIATLLVGLPVMWCVLWPGWVQRKPLRRFGRCVPNCRCLN